MMPSLNAYDLILIGCGTVFLSYFFSLASRATRIPSVLLLLGSGMGLRAVLDALDVSLRVPQVLVEFLGTLGLIMIVLEAGLDLEVKRSKLLLVTRALLSAIAVLLLSTFGVGGILWWLLPQADFRECLVYGVTLGVVSSAIVLPSVHHLSESKREFLIYEAAFSDVLGIMLFNFLATEASIEASSLIWLLGSVPVALILSVGVCLGLLFLLAKSRINAKFFFIFAVLMTVYILGKKLELPSLLPILLFGLVVNNWVSLTWGPLKALLPDNVIQETSTLLKSLTGETSFLIRTFFFVVFGMHINVAFLANAKVWILGLLIVATLLLARFIYLRVVLRGEELFPGLFYIPRGLISVLLFFKIPSSLQLASFDEGILFFVVIGTNIIMMVASLLYRDRPVALGNQTGSNTGI